MELLTPKVKRGETDENELDILYEEETKQSMLIVEYNLVSVVFIIFFKKKSDKLWLFKEKVKQDFDKGFRDIYYAILRNIITMSKLF